MLGTSILSTTLVAAIPPLNIIALSTMAFNRCPFLPPPKTHRQASTSSPIYGALHAQITTKLISRRVAIISLIHSGTSTPKNPQPPPREHHQLHLCLFPREHLNHPIIRTRLC
jgi:hypothetical protein